MGSNETHDFPSFDDLPRVPGQPQGCLWGFFGATDELGTLNLLTADTVRAAAAEVQTGRHIQLDWPLSSLSDPGFGRIPLEHTIKDLGEHGFVGHDDVIRINTQTSSQWDSLKHFGIQSQGLYYNGLRHQDASKSSRNGIHNICDRGGIVGRGILVDWLRWWEHMHPGATAPSAVTRHCIPTSELDAALKWQGTECRQGDILIVRSGFVKWHNEADTQIRRQGCQDKHDMIGVENSMETVRWLYDHHFSAVAGDTMGFEAWPYPADCCLHEWLLCQWGTPIGELWDLEQLSAECVAQNRWSFMVTSAPLRVEGGVASPPNVIAIF